MATRGVRKKRSGLEEDRSGRPGDEIPVLIRKPETRNRKERVQLRALGMVGSVRCAN